MREQKPPRRHFIFALAVFLSSSLLPTSLLAAPPGGDSRHHRKGADRPGPNKSGPSRPPVHGDRGRGQPHYRAAPPPRHAPPQRYIRKRDHGRPHQPPPPRYYRRPPFGPGYYVPHYRRHHIRPAPPHIIMRMGNIGGDYVVGYIDGFAVVYNPRTFFVLRISKMPWD